MSAQPSPACMTPQSEQEKVSSFKLNNLKNYVFQEAKKVDFILKKCCNRLIKT